MKRLSITLSLLSLLLASACLLKPWLYISGDEGAAGAEIFIDGEKVGDMARYVYDGNDGEKLKKGDVYSFVRIKISNGTHTIEFVGKDGRRLQKKITMKGENYIEVDFEKMTISGGD